MKIGILTFHRAINYGAVLQCYALYRTLCDIGHDVEVIDYRPTYIERYRQLFNLKGKSLISKSKEITRSLLMSSEIKKTVRNFDDFLQRIKLSSIVSTAEDIISQHYDIIVCGSDQVWNKKIADDTYDEFFWGQFDHPGSTFITYAASYGTLVQSVDTELNLKRLLTKVDGIGVREKDLADYISSLGFKAYVCVDPTVLADRQHFVDLAEEPLDDNYILIYALKDRLKVVNWAKKLQSLTGLKIIVLGGNVAYKQNYGKDVEVVQGVSPCVFLGYYKKARYVVNASFHGTVFSTIFKRDFFSINVANSDRYEQYLKSVGLSERFVNLSDMPNLEPVDYSGFDDRKEKLVNDSESYLSCFDI